MNLRFTKSLIYWVNQVLAGRAGHGGHLRVCRYSVGGGRLEGLGAFAGPSLGAGGGWRLPLFVCATAGLYATASLAQDANYTSTDATPDKPVQLSYHAFAHKNCTPARLPTIRVIEAPKVGTLTVRKTVLTTDKVAGCPGLKTPAQVVLYVARTGYAGPDHVKYEVTSENGEIATYDVTITVTAAPPGQSPPADSSGARQTLRAAASEPRSGPAVSPASTIDYIGGDQLGRVQQRLRGQVGVALGHASVGVPQQSLDQVERHALIHQETGERVAVIPSSELPP